MLSCLIIEDEPLARKLLADYIQKVPELQLLDACADAMTGRDVLRKQHVDILFLDVQMPEITGISFLKTLQRKPFVILTTAYSQYALEGYELDVVDYLLKPITFERFLKAVEKVNERISTRGQAVISTEPKTEADDFVFVKDGTKLVKVQFDDILYVEGLKDYVTIHTVHQKIVTLLRLKSLEEQLPANRFFRIHHSYIVAVKAIDVVFKNEIKVGSAVLPISDSYRKAFKDFIEKKQMGN